MFTKRTVFFIFYCHYVYSEDLKDLSTPQLLKLGQDVSVLHPYEAHSSDVQFYLRNREISEAVLITSENRDLVDNARKSKFVVHGWLENHRRSWLTAIADEFLKTDDFNIFIVDWEKPARTAYASSAKNTKIVGYEIANFIKNANLSPKDIHLIGHSLGSHAVGFTGKKLQEKSGKIQRISGLDPAGPYFKLPNINSTEKLDKSDAEVVDIIHTDAGFYGYEDPLGSLDIYVNGGQRVQPGCLDEFISPTASLGDALGKSFCSHSRSTKYFTEWINQRKFKCRFCQPVLGINLFGGDRCTFHHTDQLVGINDVTRDLTGICFATTNLQEPYLT